MKAYLKYFLLFLIVSCLSSTVKAQQIENLSSSFDGSFLTITYDLIEADTTHRFNVAVFYSLDDYAENLGPVTGSVGDKLKGGKKLKIVWDPRKILPPDFDDDLIFKIRVSRWAADANKNGKKGQSKNAAKMITKSATALALITPFENSYRRGTSMEVVWTGGKPDDRLVAVLTDGQGKKEILLSNVLNNGKVDITFPAKQKTGKGYTLKLLPNGRSADALTSTPFAIHYRTPLVLKVLPVIVVGSVFLFAGKKGGSGNITVPPQGDLPTPISPN